MRCRWLILLAWWTAIGWPGRLKAQAGREDFDGTADALGTSGGLEVDRLVNVPVYVISEVEATWRRVKEALASLHLMAERVHTSKPSLRQAQEMYAAQSHHRDNLSVIAVRREVALMTTWDRLLRHVVSDPDMADDDFACIFEDDVALPANMSRTAARRAIQHGMDLARIDGLLYLGPCGHMCSNEPAVWLDMFEFRRCNNLCS